MPALLLSLLACASADPVVPDDSAASPADSAVTTSVIDSSPVYLDECHAFASRCQDSTEAHCGACQYHVRHDAGTCTAAQPCDALLLL